MMATGYVHPVANGNITTLRDFALHCSWSMMALVTLRDEDHSGPPPRALPPPDMEFYDKRLAEAQEELNRLSLMSSAEQIAYIDARYTEDLKNAQKFDAEEQQGIDRVRAMRDKVAAYTDGPDGLQRMMLDNIDRSLEGHDYRAADYVKRVDFNDVWRRAVEAVGRAHGDIEREKALHASRNAWLQQLWASLDALPTEETAE